MVEPAGTHLLECSGNSRWRQFGLMSAARWTGVAVTKILEQTKPKRTATRVLISGFDRHLRGSSGSAPGASWIFTVEQLERAGAFFATAMNGKPLPKDHGAPVRLIMPGWYGCTCIKWVDEIRWVGDDERSTSQMEEFAGRTHQEGVPRLARDFKPASMDLAAMPVRVEKSRVDGAVQYRLVGILWGGSRTTDKLQIRFNPKTRYVPVDAYEHKTTRTWTLWSHTWKPASRGRYRIELKVDDPKIRTRRLDSGTYRRTVVIDEV